MKRNMLRPDILVITFPFLMILLAGIITTIIYTGHDEWKPHFHSGAYLLRNGNYNKAVSALAKAIELAPTNADAYAERGNAYFCLADLDRASQDYKRSLEIEHDNPYVVLQLHLARKGLGMKEAFPTLVDLSRNIDLDMWPGPILAYFLTKTRYKELMESISHNDKRIEKVQRCEALFYVAEDYVFSGKKTQAKDLLRQYLQTGCEGSWQHRQAVETLESLESERGGYG